MKSGRPMQIDSASWDVFTRRTVIALAVVLLTGYGAARVHPDMGLRVFDPRMPVVRGIQNDITMRRLFSHTLQPLLLLFLVRAVKFLLAVRSVFVLHKLRAKQATAFMRAAWPAEFHPRLFGVLGTLL